METKLEKYPFRDLVLRDEIRKNRIDDATG